MKREEEHEHRMMSMFTGFMMQMTQVMSPTMNSYGFPSGSYGFPYPSFCSSSNSSSYSMCNSQSIPNQEPIHSHEQNSDND